MEEAFWLLRSVILHYLRAQAAEGAIYPFNIETQKEAAAKLLKLAQLYEGTVSTQCNTHKSRLPALNPTIVAF